MTFASSEDSDLPDHPPSLIRVIAVRMKKHWVLSYPLSALRRLWSAWADIGHWPILLFCLFVLKLNVPVNNFSVMSGRSHRFLGNNQYVWGVKCLAQGQNTAAVGFESPTSRSGVPTLWATALPSILLWCGSNCALCPEETRRVVIVMSKVNNAQLKLMVICFQYTRYSLDRVLMRLVGFHSRLESY